MPEDVKLVILGAGNIGVAIARGLIRADGHSADEILLTRRNAAALESLSGEGFAVSDDNGQAVDRASTVILAVPPQQLDGLLEEIGPRLDGDRHTVISVVSGASIADIRSRLGNGMPVVRAMPNVAIAVGRSMTCLSGSGGLSAALDVACRLFDRVGTTLVVDEEQMIPATALCACGVAFFLRGIRAASQGGIEIGFHPEEALTIAAQTALGASALLLEQGRHPERDIDTVTTPRGCTISGLNELEHQGFSSAMIKGILTSAHKASGLYSRDDA